MKKNTDLYLTASNEYGLELNNEKTKWFLPLYLIRSHDKNIINP
jgi:hypothetical protein